MTTRRRRHPRMPQAGVVLATALATVALLAGCGGEPNHPLELLTEHSSSERIREYTFQSQALGRRTKVDVLLPPGYGSTDRRYPVLYLLHGAGADFRFWPAAGIESLVGDRPLIVVMPDGDTGFYSDPYNDGAGGPPRWETYHLDELVPWIDSNLRTRAEAANRAVAGVSMGGLGALLYAARQPHLFAFAASISGPVDVKPGPMAKVLLATGRDPALLEPIWGPYPLEANRWRQHDPVALAGTLRGVQIVLSTGTGPAVGGRGAFNRLEAQIAAMNRTLHRRLLAIGISHDWEIGPGVHAVPDWQDALARILPEMIRVLDPGRPRIHAAAAVAQ